MSRVSVLAIISSAAIGCDFRGPTPSPPNAMPQGPYEVRVDLAALGIDPLTHVAGSRKADEEAAMARLLALYSPEEAQNLARDLDENAPGRIYAVDDNEEAARLISIIYAIRDADQTAKTREMLARRGLRIERRR